MSSPQKNSSITESNVTPFGIFAPAMEYAIDAAQRSVLLLDVMRQRGNQYREHMAESAPHVLDYKVELVVDGRTLERPVNYGLVRVVPPTGVEINPKLRPFIVVDPRAGHGPGIGGFKADSEIGVALQAGRACERPRPRQVRWCRIGAEFRESESGEHALDKAIQSLFEDRHGSPALSWIREVVGRPRQPKRGGNPVHR